jgi:hypothetical protein
MEFVFRVLPGLSPVFSISPKVRSVENNIFFEKTRCTTGLRTIRTLSRDGVDGVGAGLVAVR